MTLFINHLPGVLTRIQQSHIEANPKKSFYFKTFRSIFIITCLYWILGSQSVLAQWSADPAVNTPISTATNSQYLPAIVSDGAGGAIITWYDTRDGGGHNNDIYVQRINACGVVQWTVDGLAICTAINSQYVPSIVSDGEGGAIITWNDNRNGSNYDIYAQRIDATGTVRWAAEGLAVCTEKSDQFSTSSVSDGSGGVIITWYDNRNGNGDNVYAQRINASGAAQWTADGVAVCTATNSQNNPIIISDGSGGAIITWNDGRNPTGADIYAQRINATGAVQWTTDGVAICTAANAQFSPTMISDQSGGAILTWNDKRSGNDYDIYAQRINATGVVQWIVNGVAICTAINDQLIPTITSDGSNGAIITWNDNRSGSNNDIYAQRVNASGAVQWTTDGVSIRTATKSQWGPGIVSDGSGGAIITRNDNTNGSNYDIYAQRISASGAAQWTTGGVAICTAPNNQFNPAITADGSNGAIITWVDVRNNWDFDIYAQNVNSNGMIGYIAPLPEAVSIGPDTSICKGNSIMLNAHRGYTTYRWNNGSVDSILTVSSPGKYYIDVTDACGNFSSDTLIVSLAPPIVFDIGPDRIKCNNDTLHLVASSGFLNYSWGPGYNISTQSAQQVIVQPTVDTLYFVKAEKTAGCFAYDSVRIKVNQSPLIDLGGDISFCSGDSAVLNVGAGFAQYLWSNGSLLQQVSVYAPGEYSIIGITGEGCQSYDTLNVVNVWPNPVVTLNSDPQICTGSTRTLQAGNYSSYLWQDGSTSASFVATGTGTYYVTVLDDHQCTGSSDTVHITTLLPAPADFLPADTAICNYGTFLLKPAGNYNNYTWSNNSSSSSINISVPGIYWLQVKDLNNCTGRDSILIGLKECLKGFNIPTAFTPDNNGLNDYFKPVLGGTVKQYQFTIYNRWGQLVFTTKDLYKGWDGTFGGITQDMNVFAWTCTYQLEGEAVKQEKGTVVVVR